MTRGEAIKQFLWKSILPTAAATLLVCIGCSFGSFPVADPSAAVLPRLRSTSSSAV